MNEVSELVFILDKSGSMAGKEEDVIGGFNSSISEQAKKDYETLVTTVLFSDDHAMLHDRVNIKAIKKMTRNDYVTNGCTALIDTIGETIEHIKKVQKYVENKPKKTLFIIMTDGLENASHKYSSDEVKKMIEKQKENHWEFIFMGANIDAVQTAKEFGISESRAANFSTNKMDKVYRASNMIMDVALDVDLDETDACYELDKGIWKEVLED